MRPDSGFTLPVIQRAVCRLTHCGRDYFLRDVYRSDSVVSVLRHPRLPALTTHFSRVKALSVILITAKSQALLAGKLEHVRLIEWVTLCFRLIQVLN